MSYSKKLQQLRARRAEVTAELRELVDSNPGDKWTKAAASQYDRGLQEVDRIDGEIRAIESELNGGGQAPRSGAESADSAIFRTVRDAETGREYPVLRKGDDFRARLQAAGRIESHGQDGFGLADFVRGVAGLEIKDHGTRQAVQNALSVGTDSAGGFSVPSIIIPGLLEALVPASSLLSAGAGVTLLDQGSKVFRLARVLTIPTAAWRNESATLAESDPSFGAIDITPRSLSFFFRVSRELLMDGANIEQALLRIIAQSMARELDRVGLRGTGTAPQPRGILNTSGIQAVTNGANGASIGTSLRYSNLISAMQAILQADAPTPTAAIMSPRSLANFGALADTTNQPLRRPEVLQNLQFLTTSQVPNNLMVGTSTDCTEIYVADFRWFNFFFREQLSIQLLRERYADTGEIGFVAHSRADVAALYPAAFAVATGVRP